MQCNLCRSENWQGEVEDCTFRPSGFLRVFLIATNREKGTVRARQPIVAVGSVRECRVSKPTFKHSIVRVRRKIWLIEDQPWRPTRFVTYRLPHRRTKVGQTELSNGTP